MAKKDTRLENMIHKIEGEQLSFMANLGEVAKEIVELKRRVSEIENDIYDLKKGTEFEAGEPKETI